MQSDINYPTKIYPNLSTFSISSTTSWVLVAQLCQTLCSTMDCSLSVSSVHGILLVGILEWVASPFSRGSFQPRIELVISWISGRYFMIWATRETHHSYCKLKSSNPSYYIFSFFFFLFFLQSSCHKGILKIYDFTSRSKTLPLFSICLIMKANLFTIAYKVLQSFTLNTEMTRL